MPVINFWPYQKQQQQQEKQLRKKKNPVINENLSLGT